jgi:hypothetical protein
MQSITQQQAFYKRLEELTSKYNQLFGDNFFNDTPEDIPSYYAGILAGISEIKCYLTNHEPWSREALILEIVVEERRILLTRDKNKNVKGFNMVYSKGQEEAMNIIRNEISLFFPYFTRNIVVCRS